MRHDPLSHLKSLLLPAIPPTPYKWETIVIDVEKDVFSKTVIIKSHFDILIFAKTVRGFEDFFYTLYTKFYTPINAKKNQKDNWND